MIVVNYGKTPYLKVTRVRPHKIFKIVMVFPNTYSDVFMDISLLILILPPRINFEISPTFVYRRQPYNPFFFLRHPLLLPEQAEPFRVVTAPASLGVHDSARWGMPILD